MSAQLIIDGQTYRSSNAADLHAVYMAIRAIVDRKDTNQVVFNGASDDGDAVVLIMVTEHTSVHYIVLEDAGDSTARKIIDLAAPNTSEILDLYGTGRDPLPSSTDAD